MSVVPLRLLAIQDLRDKDVSYINLLIGYGCGLYESTGSAASCFVTYVSRKNEEVFGYAESLGGRTVNQDAAGNVAERSNVGLTKEGTGEGRVGEWSILVGCRKHEGDCSALTRRITTLSALKELI
jgi:hypothetical protein